jgi:hypothetical protein
MRRRGVLVVMALVAMLVLAWNLLGHAGGDSHARTGARNAASAIAVGALPGDGAPSESPHHPVERKKPRQFELAVALQVDATAPAPSSTVGIALIAGTDAPAADTPSTVCIADITQLPAASADVGQLRLHPGQAPPPA